MSKKTRRVIFYFSILLFFLASYIMVRFSLGFGFDIKEFKFVKTGAISIISNNASAEVFFDNDFIGKTSIIGNSFNKKHLLPGTYQISIEKEGYKKYEKEVILEPREVVFIAANLFKNSYEELIFNEEADNILASNSYRIEKLFRDDDKTLVFTTGEHILIDQDSVKKLIIPSAIKNITKDILFRNNELFLKTKNKIYSYDDEAVNLIKDFYIDVDIFDNSIYYLNEKDRFLYKEKIDGGDITKISEEKLDDIKKLKINVFDSQLIVLLVDEKFIYILKEDKAFEKFEIKGHDLKISPGKNKLVIWNDKEISVFWLEDEFYPVISKKYSRELIVRLASKIDDVWWYESSNNILFITENNINIVEVDRTGGRNQFEIIDGVELVEYSEKQDDLVLYKDEELLLIDLE